MPSIRPYEAQISSSGDLPRGRVSGRGGARATGSDFLTSAGDSGREIQNAGAALYDIAERQEVSDIGAKLAKARAEWTVHLQERAASAQPGDPTFAENFNKEFGDYLNKMGEGVYTAAGQRAFQRESGELAAHFVERAGVYQVQSAGRKAVQDFRTRVDNDYNTLANDPTQHESVRRAAIEALNDPAGMYARMPAEERAKLQREVEEKYAKATINGVARLDPDLAEKQLKEGRYNQFLNAEAIEGAYSSIRTQQALKRDAENQTRLAEERAQQKREEENARKFSDELIRADLSGGLDTAGPRLLRELLRTNDLTSRQKDHFRQLINAGAKEGDRDKTTYGPAIIGVIDKIHAGAITDPADVEAMVGKGLTIAGMSAARQEIIGRKTLEGAVAGDMKKNLLATAKREIGGSDELFGTRDPKGDALLERATFNILQAYEAGKRKGLSNEQMFDPDSNDYIGKTIRTLRRAPEVYLRDLREANATGLSGSITPAVPGTEAPKTFNTPAELKDAVAKGAVSRTDAERIGREKGWIK